MRSSVIQIFLMVVWYYSPSVFVRFMDLSTYCRLSTHTLVLYACRNVFCRRIRCSMALGGIVSPPSNGINFHPAVGWWAYSGGVLISAVIMESSVVLDSSRENVAFITWVIIGRFPGRGQTWRWGVSSNVETLGALSISSFAACA